MKLFLNLCLLSSLLLGQELHFSFYGNTDQSFPVPFDTTHRNYPIPYELLEIGTTQQLELTFSACERMTFCIDDVRFPSNGFIDFEIEDDEVNFSEGVLSAQHIQHPSDSGYVLQIDFDQSHAGDDTVWVEVPDNSFPMIPEYVGLTIQSSVSVDLWNYIPLRDYMPLWSTTRFRSSDPGWDYNTLIETINNSITSYDSIVNSTLRWQYSDESNAEVRLDERSYTYRYDEPEKISIDEMSFDFGLGLGEHSGSDSTWGARLDREQYENILGQPTFVKRYGLDGPIGSNLYFGYGVGLVREDFAGTSVHDDLVGVRTYDAVQGDLEHDVTLSIGADQDFPILTTFPPDSCWFHYKIPISKLYYPEYSLPRSMDSLFLVLMPEIIIDEHTGQLQIADLQLFQESIGILHDFSHQSLSDWKLDCALNGSHIGIQTLTDTPPDESGSGFELMFYNDMIGSTHFAGFASLNTHFDQTIQVDPNMYLQFWMRQAPPISGLDNYDILPKEFGIVAAYPNPFNGEIAIDVRIPDNTEDAELTIHDIQGREVWSYSIESISTSQQLVWTGQDQNGRTLSSGIYIATMKLGQRAGGAFQKLTLIK